MNKALYAVIIAGGSGTRFWPMSRGGTPKQFLRLLSERTMLEETLRRIVPLIPVERVFVVTGQSHARIVRDLLPELPPDNLLLEPMARNTAPCIGLAALAVRRRDPEGIMAVLPADHFVADEQAFCSVIFSACRLAEDGGMVTAGIRPMRPETGYGYLRLGEPVGAESARFVDAFVEKPDFDTAVQYLGSGRYLWNSGMFFFKAATIIREFGEHLPRLSSALGRIDAAWGAEAFEELLEQEYNGLRPISIDYGVMEKASDIAVVVARFAWSDVGTWAALREVLPRGENDSVAMGEVLEIDGHGNILIAESGLIAALGLGNMIVVRSRDSVLVCPRRRAQDVRKIVEMLREAKKEEFL